MWRARYRTPQKAHRIAWELTHGPIADGLFVLHTCDVPLCCNPQHLFLGTQRDNIRDAAAKGRLSVSRSRVRGLTLAERLTIYYAPRDRATGAALARRYGVSKTCIHHTRRGRFVGAPVFERVPHVQLPVRGELHLSQQGSDGVGVHVVECLTDTAERASQLSCGGVR